MNASDPDGDTLVFSATNLPPGLSIDPNTGKISGSPTAGSAGGYPVSVKVDDQHGGTRTVNFTWTVKAPVVGGVNQPPSCSAVQPSVLSLWPADHRLVPVQIYGVADADGDQTTVTITRILQDEPTNTFGDGTTWIDGFGIGSSIAQIRAERTGSPKLPGDGRVYQIFFSAADVHGATCTGSVLVKVPHDSSSTNAVDSGVRYDSTIVGGQPISQP